MAFRTASAQYTAVIIRASASANRILLHNAIHLHAHSCCYTMPLEASKICDYLGRYMRNSFPAHVRCTITVFPLQFGYNISTLHLHDRYIAFWHQNVLQITTTF